MIQDRNLSMETVNIKKILPLKMKFPASSGTNSHATLSIRELTFNETD